MCQRKLVSNKYITNICSNSNKHPTTWPYSNTSEQPGHQTGYTKDATVSYEVLQYLLSLGSHALNLAK